MKITVKQLKQLIKEQVEEVKRSANPYLSAEDIEYDEMRRVRERDESALRQAHGTEDVSSSLDAMLDELLDIAFDCVTSDDDGPFMKHDEHPDVKKLRALQNKIVAEFGK